MLTDYSLTSRLQREDANIIDSQGTRRSLAYIPPEGTGRVNRGVDYRADFYSLGVVFYEVFLSHAKLMVVVCWLFAISIHRSPRHDPPTHHQNTHSTT
jgi:serine/threonine protein kinase